jgi:predicted phage baseplate assembly protein
MSGALSVRTNRPGLDAIRTRIGTHDAFLRAMLDRLGVGRSKGAEEDAAVALCDAWASIADILTFYQERIANEGYLRTAVQRRSVAEIGRLVGYRMRPGVAASVALAFTLEPDAEVTLPAGTSVQSVPDGDQRARRFELTEALDARAAWNSLAVRATRPAGSDTAAAQIFTRGVTPPVRASDAVVLIGAAAPLLRRVATVTPDFAGDRCRIALAEPQLAPPARIAAKAEAGAGAGAPDPLQLLGNLVDTIRTGLDHSVIAPPRSAARLHPDLASLLAPDNDIAMRLRGLSVRDRDTGNLFAALDAVRAPAETRFEVHAMRLRSAPFGSSAAPPPAHLLEKATDWTLQEEDPRILHVEAVGGDIMPGSWVAFEAPGGAHVPPPRRVLAASVVVRVAYGMAGRCTRLELDGPWIDQTRSFADLRALTVYAGSLPLPLAEEDDPAPLGETDAIELDGLVGELAPGRILIVEGELDRHAGARQSEVVMLAGSSHVLTAAGAEANRPRTVLRLANPLAYSYRRATVSIWGNVGRATEGETVSEVLGGGAAPLGGTVALSRQPLTHVSAPTPSGAASTLQVVVNGVVWQEVESLAQAGPSDRVFVTEAAGVGPPVIRFGNGVHGARVPGAAAIVAHYRTGLGAGGNCDVDQISQLLSRPAGVHGVTNPRPASGGADPEETDAARRNVPIGVTALSRLVGLDDYADFARGFAGVGKADVTLFQGADGPTVLVTIAAPDSTPIAPEADLPRNLAAALEAYGDLSHTVLVLPARLLRVVLAAQIGLQPGHVWDWVAPRVKAALLDRFGFPRRDLGQALFQSEVIAAIQAVEGVADTRIATLAALGDPVTTAMLAELVQASAVEDVRARTGRLVRQGGRAIPCAAEVAFFSSLMPELISLREIGA